MNNNMDPKRPPASRVVHVRGLANGTNESVIKNLLLPYGKIVNVLMLPQNNQALIEFDNVESSKRLIYSTCPPAKPLNIAGVPCYFNFSTSQFIQKNSSNRVDRQPPAQKILLFTIHNAKYSITVDTIKKICEPYGQVIKIVIFHKNELHALVQFLDVFTAQKVKQNLEGCDIYADCCTLKIEYARTDELKVNKNDTQTWDIYRENPGLVPPPPVSIPYNVPPGYMPPPLQGTDGIRHQIPGLPHGFPPPLPPGVGIPPPFLPPTPVPTPSPSLSNLSNNPPNPYNRYDNQQSLKPETTVITAPLDDDLKTIKTHPYYQQYYEQYLTSTGSETAAQAAAKAAALAALKIERSAAAAAAASACASNNSPSPSSHHMREGSLGGMVGSSLQPPHEPPTNFLGSAHHLQQGGLPPPLPPPSHLASHQSYLQTHHTHHQNNRINSNVLGPPPLMQSNQHLNPHHASLRLPSLHPNQNSNYGKHQSNVRGPLRPLLSPYQGSSLLRDNITNANANTSYRNKLQSLRPPLIASSSTINGRSGKLPSVFDRIGGTNAYKNSTESSNALIGGNKNGPRTLLPPISSRPQLTHLKPPSNITKGGSVARLLGDRKSSGGVISIDRLSKLRRETGLRGTTKAVGLLDKTANSDAFSSIVYRACDKVVIIDGIDIWHLNCKKLFNLFSAFGTVNKLKILHDPIDRAILEYKDGQSAQGLFIDDSFNNHMPLLTFFTIDPDSQEIQVSHNIYLHVAPSPLAYDEIYDDYENTQPHIPKNNGDMANIQQMQTQTCQEIDSTVENENNTNMIGETISIEMVDVIKSEGNTNQTKEEHETNDTSLDENKTSTSSAVLETADIIQTNDQENIIGSSETLGQPKSNVADSNYDAINIEVNTTVEVDDEIYADLMGEETLITDDNTSAQQQNLPNTTSITYSEHTSTVVLQNSQTNDNYIYNNNENENNDQPENEVLHHVLPDGSPFNIEDFTTLYSLDDAIILYNLNSVQQEASEIKKNGTESLSMNLLESALAIMDEERGLDLPSHLVRQIHLQKAPIITSTESVKMRKTMVDTKNSETTALKSDNTNLALYTISLHFPTTLILICNLPVDINVNKLTCMFEDILTVPNRILCGNYSGEKTVSLPAKNLIIDIDKNDSKTTDMEENNKEMNIEKNDHVDAINDASVNEKNGSSLDSEQVKESYMVGEWSESEIQFLSSISHTDNVLAYQDKDIVTTRCQNALVEFESLTDAVRAICLSNFSIIPYIKPGVEEKPYYFLIKLFFCHMKNEFNPMVVHDVNAGEEETIKSLKRKL